MARRPQSRTGNAATPVVPHGDGTKTDVLRAAPTGTTGYRSRSGDLDGEAPGRRRAHPVDRGELDYVLLAAVGWQRACLPGENPTQSSTGNPGNTPRNTRVSPASSLFRRLLSTDRQRQLRHPGTPTRARRTLSEPRLGRNKASSFTVITVPYPLSEPRRSFVTARRPPVTAPSAGLRVRAVKGAEGMFTALSALRCPCSLSAASRRYHGRIASGARPSHHWGGAHRPSARRSRAARGLGSADGIGPEARLAREVNGHARHISRVDSHAWPHSVATRRTLSR